MKPDKQRGEVQELSQLRSGDEGRAHRERFPGLTERVTDWSRDFKFDKLENEGGPYRIDVSHLKHTTYGEIDRREIGEQQLLRRHCRAVSSTAMRGLGCPPSPVAGHKSRLRCAVGRKTKAKAKPMGAIR